MTIREITFGQAIRLGRGDNEEVGLRISSSKCRGLLDE